jgi:hypothetical protein
MLKLIFDVKCGYENDHVEIKDYEFDLSFLCKEAYWKILSALGKGDLPEIPPTENELFVGYSQRPEALVRDYDIGEAVLNFSADDIGRKRFPEILQKDTAPLVFPELFVMKNVRLDLIDSPEESESDQSLKDAVESAYGLTDEEVDDLIDGEEDWKGA